MTVPAYTLENLGDAALLLRFGDLIDVEMNAAVHRVATRLRAHSPAWVQDVVPAYSTLAIVVDEHADTSPPWNDHTHPDVLQRTAQWVRAVLASPADASLEAPVRLIDIPVRYGGEFGPDLDAVAQHAHLSVADVIHRHTQAEYVVAMLGFSPGFPYLLGLDAALATPRLATPRQRVEAGSVAIGGSQAGLYPQAGPGGWRVIGRTDAVLFDPENHPPTALQPGDRVRFVERDRR